MPFANSQQPFAFAFRAKPEASEQRIDSGYNQNRPTSDNGNSVAYVNTFALAITDPLICERFWSHVDKLGSLHPILGTRCWLWTANVVGHGNKNRRLNSCHGQFTYRLSGQRQQHHVYAHRFAWGITYGPIEAGLQILHQCDVPPCVNVAHLFTGSQADNMKDAARKHRFTVPRTRSLTLFERLAIYHTQSYRGVGEDLAKQYGVTPACISLTRSGRFIGAPHKEKAS